MSPEEWRHATWMHCEKCPSVDFRITLPFGQWYAICQGCSAEYALLGDGNTYRLENISTNQEKTA